MGNERMSADDEPTRVLKQAAPVVVGSKVAFPCPNGHRVLAPLELAGKRGKCSKCGVDVTIPKPAGAAAGPVAEVASPVPPPAAPPPTVPPPAVTPPTVLAAAVPDLQFQPPPEPAVEASPAAEPEAGGDDAPAEETWDFIGTKPAAPAPAAFEAEGWQGNDSSGGQFGDGGNPTAMLVGRLWAERQHGGVIELHLSGGSVILPEWYDVNWSRGTHGLFASQAADGSVTLTAVAWETVQKIVVRQLTEVPDDMFT